MASDDVRVVPSHGPRVRPRDPVAAGVGATGAAGTALTLPECLDTALAPHPGAGGVAICSPARRRVGGSPGLRHRLLAPRRDDGVGSHQPLLPRLFGARVRADLAGLRYACGGAIRTVRPSAAGSQGHG